MRRIAPWLALVVLCLAGVWIFADSDAPRGVAPSAPSSRAPLAPALQQDGGPSEEVEGVEHAPERAAAAAPAVEADVESNEVEGTLVCVVDVANTPIEGARVRRETPKETFEGVTGTDGTCRLPFEPPEEGWSAIVEAEGYFPTESYRWGENASCIQLHPMGRLAGRVVERETRAPVSGARVWVPWRDYGEVPSVAVATDAAGRFDGVEIPLGKSFSMAVRAEGFLDEGFFANTLVVAPDEREPSTEILLERALVVDFLVVDSASGAPVEGASVFCYRGRYESDVEGRVRVDRSLRATDVGSTLTVDAGGYCLTRFDLSDLAERATPTLLELPRACSIVGEVRDAQGRPLVDANVSVTLTDDVAAEFRSTGKLPRTPESAVWAPNARWERSTDRAWLRDESPGRFELSRVPPGLPEIELVVQRRGRTLAARTVGPLGPPGSSLYVDWQLEPMVTAEVRGRLLLNGEPHAGFVTWMNEGMESYTAVGDDGVFAFSDVVPGRVELHGNVRDQDGHWGIHGGVTSTVDVAAGQLAERDLDCVVATSEVTGSVSDPDGRAAEGVEVVLVRSEEQSRFSTTSDQQGAWSIVVADVAGTYRIDSKSPLREQGQEVRAGAREVALHLVSVGRLRYRVLDAATGERLSSVLLSHLLAGDVVRTLGFPSRDAPDTTGWTEVELPEGVQELAAWTLEGEHRTQRRSVTVVPGETCEVEFRLEPAEILSLRLVEECGAFPSDHLVLILPEDEWPLVSATSNPGGRPQPSFEALPSEPGRDRHPGLQPGRVSRVIRLAPGRYRFKVFPDDVAIEPEFVDVPAEGVVDVRWVSKP